MKKRHSKWLSITILILIVFITGCGVNKDSISQEDYLKIKQELAEARLKIEELEKNESINSEKDLKDLRILSHQDNRLMYVYEEDKYSATEVITIIGDNGSELVESEKIETLDLTGKEGYVVKLKVLGSIYDFKIVELAWNEKTEDLDEVKNIYELEEVQNKDIIFNSMLPEGMPSEAIKWKDKDGNEQIYYLSYDGYGFDGTIILNK